MGVSYNHDAVQRRWRRHASASVATCRRRVSAVQRGITHPDANKGCAVRYLSKKYELPAEEIAAIGDMPNDVLMFAYAGLSIAMGNASAKVQRAARRVTTSNQDEGFANAVERFVLP